MERVEGFRGRALVACAAAFAVGLIGLAGEANAQFDELVPTKIGLVKFAGSPAVGKLYKLVSKPATVGTLFKLPSADPATTGGSLAVGISPGRLDCTLAAQPYDGIEGWKTLGPPATPKGYKYINNLAPGGIAGPCKMILVKQKVIKVIAKGTGGLPAPLGPGLNPDIDTVLTLGGDDYCAKADVPPPHFKEVADKLIKAKNQLAPVACPVIPSTTTTLPGTTTTTGGETTTTTGGETTTTTSITPTTTTTTLPPQALDHYRLYWALGPDGPPVLIEDQFRHGPDYVDLGMARYFLVPVDKNGHGIINPVDHLTCYDIPQGTFSALVTVSNQFDDLGPQTLEVYDPDALCVPTEKNPMPPGQPLMRDHYKCYGAAGFPVFRSVTLMDQFQDQSVMVLHPILFCNPADKNGEGIVNQSDHLTCYATDPPGFGPPWVTIRNQFHQSEYLELGASMALCVPGKKIGWTTTTTTPETTTTTVIETTTTTSPPTTTTTMPPPIPCEVSMPPWCDGACPPGTECVQAGPSCICEQSIAVCGDGQFPAPQCWGSCPPQAPICRDMGGMCQCMPF